MNEWNGFDYSFDYDYGFVLITLMAIEKDHISSP